MARWQDGRLILLFLLIRSRCLALLASLLCVQVIVPAPGKRWRLLAESKSKRSASRLVRTREAEKLSSCDVRKPVKSPRYGN